MPSGVCYSSAVIVETIAYHGSERGNELLLVSMDGRLQSSCDGILVRWKTTKPE